MAGAELILPRAPLVYDQRNEQQTRDELQRNDTQILRRDKDADLPSNVRLVLTDTVTGTRYSVTIVSGVLTLTAL